MKQNFHWNTDRRTLNRPFSDALTSYALEQFKASKGKAISFYQSQAEDDVSKNSFTFEMSDFGIYVDENGEYQISDDRPPLCHWLMRSNKLQTDLGNEAMAAPFVYIKSMKIDNGTPTPVVDNTTTTAKAPTGNATKDSTKTKNKKSTAKDNKSKKTDTPTQLTQVLKGDDALAYIDDLVARLDKMTEEERNTFFGSSRSLRTFKKQYTDGKLKEYIKGALSTLPDMCVSVNEKGIPSVVRESTLEAVANKNAGVTVTTRLVATLDEEDAARYSTEENEKDAEKVDDKEAVDWLIKKLGLSKDQVQVVRHVMKMSQNGPAVFGVTRLAAEKVAQIIFSKKAARGIQYHEGWHYVNLFLHSKDVRTAVYMEYIKQHPEAGKLSNEVIEERLAEEFRSWALGKDDAKKQNRQQGIIRRIFSNIYKFVKQLFTKQNSRSVLENVYENIYNGRYANTKMDNESVKEFERAYRSKEVYLSTALT
ncbi:MAG: hypothetical protein EOM41_08140 [Bacilli bacterium]|nr:hypothetical protein [Bacilli bacterium]